MTANDVIELLLIRCSEIMTASAKNTGHCSSVEARLAVQDTLGQISDFCLEMKGRQYVDEGIPSQLRSDAFGSVWSEWVQYRKKKRQTLTETTIKRQLKKLAQMGLEGAIASLEQSMEQGWTGLFPARSSTKGVPDEPRPGARYKEDRG